jgi:hypothetical protein
MGDKAQRESGQQRSGGAEKRRPADGVTAKASRRPSSQYIAEQGEQRDIGGPKLEPDRDRRDDGEQMSGMSEPRSGKADRQELTACSVERPGEEQRTQVVERARGEHRRYCSDRADERHEIAAEIRADPFGSNREQHEQRKVREKREPIVGERQRLVGVAERTGRARLDGSKQPGERSGEEKVRD